MRKFYIPQEQQSYQLMPNHLSNMEQSHHEKWVFIVNPTAGNHFARTLIPKLESEIRKHQIDAKIILTISHGHASELAQISIKSGAKYIVAVGGDGTLNEVAKMLIGNKNVVLGIIPAGTGNDFIQIPGFPNRFEEQHWDIFFQKNTILMDAGTCNGVPFFNGMGVGFDAEVAAKNYLADGTVKKGGKDKYWSHIIKTLLFYNEKEARVNNNGQKTSSSNFMKTIAIGRRFAGDFFITPRAIANDGLLDVCSIQKLTLLQRFKILMQVPKGQHLNDPNVHYDQTQGLEMEFDAKVPFHVDGELYFASKFEVAILPEAVNIIYNPEGSHFFSV
ncbi:MAG: diacylglycerol kinase family protein [Prolixibacteraceae bacterium]